MMITIVYLETGMIFSSQHYGVASTCHPSPSQYTDTNQSYRCQICSETCNFGLQAKIACLIER